MLDRQGFTMQFGVEPGQFADYLALVGDSIDDIPGLPGVGPKTAAQLLQAMGDLDTLELRMDEVPGLGMRGAGRLPEKLRSHWPQVQVSRQLARLASDISEVSVLPRYNFAAETGPAVADYLEALPLRGPVTRRWRAAGSTGA